MGLTGDELAFYRLAKRCITGSSQRKDKQAMASHYKTIHRDHRLQIDHDDGSILLDDLRGARIQGADPQITIVRGQSGSLLAPLQWSGTLQELVLLLELGLKTRELHRLAKGSP